MKNISLKTAGFGMALVMGLATQAYATITVVSPGNMNGWSFLTTDNSGNPAPGNGNTAQMVAGPATPPSGVGSAQLATASGQGDSSAQILTTAYNGMALSSLTALSYSTYDTLNNGQQFPYLKISLSDGNALFFEPPYQTPGAGGPGVVDQGSTAMNQWQTWNASAGGWWDSGIAPSYTPELGSGGYGGVGTLASYLVIAGNADVTITGISLRVGYASDTDNFNGYVDNFTIGINGADTTYDFEPAPVPEPTTMVAGALLLLPFGFSTFRMLRKAHTA